MIKKIDEGKHGKIDYSMSDVTNDLPNLPKIGIPTGCTAQGILGGNLVVYYFTAKYDSNNVPIEGVWNEI